MLLAAGEAPTDRPSAKHWAFLPPKQPNVPSVRDSQWSANPIDAFIAAEHDRRDMRPVGPAQKHVLLRRVYLDLIGLPPTPEEVRAFLSDTSTDAYERVVDRLLASPHYGERWGRHWMDVWRYSDWAGYGQEIRQSQRHIWRWRDWIIESLNSDKPYDRMIVEMLAGDELAPNDPDTVRATGFLARSWFKFNRNVWLDNIVEHTSKAFLGVTLNCARCHEHKYDPIAHEEYYRFRAFFEPHSVRTDRVPGQSDLMQDGLPRVFDAEPTAATYLFERGDEAQPDKKLSIAPTVPAVLATGKSPPIEPVILPVTAWYPALRPHVQRETIAAAEAEAIKARMSLDDANRAVTDAKLQLVKIRETEAPAAAAPNAVDPTDPEAAVERAKQAAGLAELQARASDARLAAVLARVAADNARFADPPDPRSGEAAARAAAAERRAAVCNAEENVRRIQQSHAAAQQAAKPGDAKSTEAVAAAEKKLTEARGQLKSALDALAKTDANYTRLGDVYPLTSTGRRLALARWIASPQNPLAARVAVNHIWLRHFGRPLVPTVFEFGSAGQPPTHPELLDWLATQFMDCGWNMKTLHRLIVTSNTYRLASSVDERQTAIGNQPAVDPENVYLWRQNWRRMEAEVVRDSVLNVAGRLDAALGGPDVDHALGMTSARRSVYFRTAFEKQMTFLTQFDVASVNECYRRSESVVPQQALALANSAMSLTQSRWLARDLGRAVGDGAQVGADGAFIAAAFEHVLGRPPSDAERSECLRFLSVQTELLRDPTRLTPVTTGSAAELKPASDPAQRARENLVHVLFNHNEFVTIR